MDFHLHLADIALTIWDHQLACCLMLTCITIWGTVHCDQNSLIAQTLCVNWDLTWWCSQWICKTRLIAASWQNACDICIAVHEICQQWSECVEPCSPFSMSRHLWVKWCLKECAPRKAALQCHILDLCIQNSTYAYSLKSQLHPHWLELFPPGLWFSHCLQCLLATCPSCIAQELARSTRLAESYRISIIPLHWWVCTCSKSQSEFTSTTLSRYSQFASGSLTVVPNILSWISWVSKSLQSLTTCADAKSVCLAAQQSIISQLFPIESNMVAHKSKHRADEELNNKLEEHAPATGYGNQSEPVILAIYPGNICRFLICSSRQWMI